MPLVSRTIIWSTLREATMPGSRLGAGGTAEEGAMLSPLGRVLVHGILRAFEGILKGWGVCLKGG